MKIKTKIVIVVGVLILLFITLKYFYIDRYVIQTNTYEGIIISKDIDSTWIPDKRIIEEFESGLLNHLVELNKNKEKDHIYYGDIEYVIKNLKNYKRQYIGMTENGKKILYCNCFIWRDSAFLRHFQWIYNRVEVMDGGPDYFDIEYEVDTNKYLPPSINGNG